MHSPHRQTDVGQGEERGREWWEGEKETDRERDAETVWGGGQGERQKLRQ